MTLLLFLLAADPPAFPVRTSTPAILPVNGEAEGVVYRFKMRPGVPKPGETLTVQLSLTEKQDKPHPTYGLSRPMAGANLQATLVAPDGRWSDARVGLALRDAGAYGFTFTAQTEGIYSLFLSGVWEGKRLGHHIAVPIGQWPIPENVQLPPLPKKPPTPTPADLVHGRALCANVCRTDLVAGLPPAKPPEFLDSAFATALGDDALLRAVGNDQVGGLDEVAHHDLVTYLRGLHVPVRELVPAAAAYMAAELTIDKHGLRRLAETAKLELGEEQATGTVFIVFRGVGGSAARIVDFADRVARAELKVADKLGYVIFVHVPGRKEAHELGLALGLEPTYEIKGILARDAAGVVGGAFNRELKRYIGKGRFNEPRSLGGGNLAAFLTPVYLRAAELATAYYAEEREFTAFDNAFGEEKPADAADITLRNK
jgi:hypothetical protein